MAVALRECLPFGVALPPLQPANMWKCATPCGTRVFPREVAVARVPSRGEFEVERRGCRRPRVRPSCTADAEQSYAFRDDDQASKFQGEDCVDGSLLFRYSDEDPAETPEERRSPSSEAQADIGGEWANGNGSVNWVLTTDGATEEQADAIEDAVYVPPTAEGDVCTSEPSSSGEVEVKCILHLEAAALMLPHPAKAQRGGEDAFFIEGSSVGVADGGSGWAERGVNSGLFSRELLYNCGCVVREAEEFVMPQLIIEEALERTDLQGSCTITVAALSGGTLHVANLGDSGFVVVRGGKIVERSRAMEHAFNAPFQIATIGGDDPGEAEVYAVELQSRDIVVLCTDGVFDNVFDDAIEGIVTDALCEGKGPEVAAKRLTGVAQKNAAMPSGNSPFREVARAAGNPHDGGRKDDISVLVAYVY